MTLREPSRDLLEELNSPRGDSSPQQVETTDETDWWSKSYFLMATTLPAHADTTEAVPAYAAEKTGIPVVEKKTLLADGHDVAASPTTTATTNAAVAATTIPITVDPDAPLSSSPTDLSRRATGAFADGAAIHVCFLRSLS